jgi:hypothetical protein
MVVEKGVVVLIKRTLRTFSRERGGRKTLSSIIKVSTAEVLRLRATSAVLRDQSARRFAQDDDSMGV